MVNNFTNTEKSLKRWLKTKVSVTTATVVGFLIAGTITLGAGTVPEDGVYTNDILINTLQSTKVAVGQNGNLEIYSDGSVGLLLSDLQKDHSLSGIMNVLSQQNSDPNKVVLTGAIAGQGRYNENLNNMLTLGAIFKPEYKHYIEVLQRLHTIGKEKDSVSKIEGNLTTIVGKKGSKESPLILGLVGGDFALGACGSNANKPADLIGFDRTGNTSVTINNGNVFGATAGSAAISAKNISAKIIFDLKLDGSAETIINGNTNLNINGPANAAGVTAGGLAAAIGGTATSNVNGNSNIKVNSEVNANKLEGLTVGLFGGGMAVSTLGGTASANTTGTTNVEITDGLSVGVVGGGLAFVTDASQYIKDKDGNLDGTTTIDPNGLPPITISALNDGGKSTVKSGDINVALKGKTAAAAVLGNGIAVSHQNAPQGKAPTENDKISTSTVEANDITVNIDLTKNLNGAAIGNNGVIGKVKDVFAQLKNIVDPSQGTDVSKVIGSMQGAVGALKDGGIAVGVAGNGIAIAADKGVSTVKANNTTMNLNGGYIVGALGNGIAMNNAWANSTAEVGKSVINIDGEDTEVIGVSGNGLAVYYGSGNYNGSLNFEGKALVQVKDSEINIKNGSADGVFGGGIAIDDSELNNSNAEATTSGTSTINVTGGLVKDFGYEHIGGLVRANGATVGDQSYGAYFKEVQTLGDGVAIVAGGVAAGNNVKAHVENSIINISGGKVEGDILAGGLATRGAESTVTNSTINITGGEIIGSVYGQGKATEGAGKSVVAEAGVATVENSILNIDGYKNSLEKIAGFNEINIGMNKIKASEIDNYDTQLIIRDGIDVGTGKLENAGAIIFANEKENSTLMTIAKDGSALNTRLIVVDKGDKVASTAEGGSVKNTGKIQVNGITSADESKFDVKDLFAGDFTNIGMVVGEDGKAILTEGEDVVAGDVTIAEITKDATKDNITLEHVTITDGGKIDSDAVNIIGNVTNTAELEITNGSLNFDATGNIAIADKTTVTLSNETVSGSDSTDIKFIGESSTLVLNNTSVIQGVIGENTTNGKVEFIGDNSFNGTIKAKDINIATGNSVAFGEDAIGAGTITLDGDAKIAVGAKQNEVGEYYQNFFHNSNGDLVVNGSGNVILGTGNFTGEKVTVNLGEQNTFDENLLSKLDTTNVYMIKDGESLKDGKLELVYNTKLFGENNILSNINKEAYVVNDKFSDDPEIRKSQLDKIYSTNIYSETVKASYNNVKLNEETILSLARTSEVGKWTAEGKAIYDKSEYDRDGITKDYSSEVESTGLMGALSYGLDETTTAGVAFSGVKQDVDTDGGSADADLFYLGVYGNKVYGNYDFTAGLGYQFGKYEADNTIANLSTSDKYDSKTISGYVQGRYTADLGDGLSVQPKAKLGYTYVDQDDAKDAYFGVSDAKVSTFDVEVGADLVKTVALEKGKMNLLAGVSYTRAMGDTDNKFDGRFYGAKASDKFDVLGAEIAENTVKFNVGAEVEHDNGLFYNGGMTYEFGSDDTKAYGVNVGVGYRF